MQSFSLATFFLGVITMLLSCNVSTASVISCPPNNPQEASPYHRQLCFAIEQAINENALPQDYLSGNSKRQDVDHVFLRFGRRLGL